MGTYDGEREDSPPEFDLCTSSTDSGNLPTCRVWMPAKAMNNIRRNCLSGMTRGFLFQILVAGCCYQFVNLSSAAQLWIIWRGKHSDQGSCGSREPMWRISRFYLPTMWTSVYREEPRTLWRSEPCSANILPSSVSGQFVSVSGRNRGRGGKDVAL